MTTSKLVHLGTHKKEIKIQTAEGEKVGGKTLDLAEER